MRYLIITLMSLFLLACKTDEDKIPGWYTFNKKMGDITLSGDITYYKNKELKINAKVETSVLPGIAVNTTLILKGSWSYENGYLKDYLTSIKSNPQLIGDMLLKDYKEKYKDDKGSKVLEVNKKQLRLQGADGDLITYTRKQK